MSDLRDRFEPADRLDVPDLWPEAVTRAKTVNTSTDTEPSGPAVGRRLAVATFALLLFIAAAALMWNTFRHQGAPTAVDQPEPSIVEPLVISVREDPGPPFDTNARATFGDVTIDLQGIETPGDELEYPTIGFEVPIPIGTPIEIRGDADLVQVHELVPDGPGDQVVLRADRLPGDLSVLSGDPRETALSVYAETKVWSAEWGFTVRLVDPTGGPDRSILADGNAHGIPWTLVAAGEDAPTGLELRWEGPDAGVESVDASSGIVVTWHHFGDFDPDDDVIFGVVPNEAASIRHVPGWGLPNTVTNIIEVPGANWNAFAIYSYAAIGILTIRDRNGAAIGEHLIVPAGCELALDLVESFLAARQDGRGAEAFLTPETLAEFGRMGVAPLYSGVGGSAYVSSKVLFLDPAPADVGGCDVGVRLKAADGTVTEDTLHVGEKEGSRAITGLQSGVTGP